MWQNRRHVDYVSHYLVPRLQDRLLQVDGHVHYFSTSCTYVSFLKYTCWWRVKSYRTPREHQILVFASHRDTCTMFTCNLLFTCQPRTRTNNVYVADVCICPRSYRIRGVAIAEMYNKKILPVEGNTNNLQPRTNSADDSRLPKLLSVPLMLSYESKGFMTCCDIAKRCLNDSRHSNSCCNKPYIWYPYVLLFRYY